MEKEYSLEQLSSYEKVKPAPLFVRVAEQIEQRIYSGELQFGAKLPSQEEYCNLFGVSITVVREAMKSLAHSGLIEIHPGRGTFVTYLPSTAFKDLFSSILLNQDIGRWDELLDVRGIIEPGVSMLAALRVDEKSAKEMEKSIFEMSKASNDHDDFLKHDNDFHRALAKATQNTLLELIIGAVIDLLNEQRKRLLLVEGWDKRAFQHHEEIYKAVIGNKPDVAYDAMVAHLRQVREDIQRNLSVYDKDS